MVITEDIFPCAPGALFRGISNSFWLRLCRTVQEMAAFLSGCSRDPLVLMDAGKRLSDLNQPILEIRNLSVTYRGSPHFVHAVRDVSLSLAEGETLALAGETGSGKSTVALSVLGLLNAQAQAGEILFRGRSIHSLTPGEWRTIRGGQIGIVFQDSRSALNPVLTISEHVIETLRAHQKLAKRKARERALEVLQEVGIREDQANLHPFALSGGTCQRAGIALALCNEPALLIADEPTSSIDTAIQAQILDLLQFLKRRRRLALLLISHDLPLISHVSERIAVMYHGQIVESGLREEVLTAPAHPYTRGLIACQPSMRHHHEKNPLAAIPGALPAAGQEMPGCAFAPRCSQAEALCTGSVPAARALSATRRVACVKASGDLDGRRKAESP